MKKNEENSINTNIKKKLKKKIKSISPFINEFH